MMSTQTLKVVSCDSDRNQSADGRRIQRIPRLTVIGDGNQYWDVFRELLTSTVCRSVSHSGVVRDE